MSSCVDITDDIASNSSRDFGLCLSHSDLSRQARSQQPFVALEASRQGEDIGILHGDQVIALRPVTVHSDDYALREYSVTEKELDEFVRRSDQQIRRERKSDKMKVYSGDLEADNAQ